MQLPKSTRNLPKTHQKHPKSLRSRPLALRHDHCFEVERYVVCPLLCGGAGADHRVDSSVATPASAKHSQNPGQSKSFKILLERAAFWELGKTKTKLKKLKPIGGPSPKKQGQPSASHWIDGRRGCGRKRSRDVADTTKAPPIS